MIRQCLFALLNMVPREVNESKSNNNEGKDKQNTNFQQTRIRQRQILEKSILMLKTKYTIRRNRMDANFYDQ